MQPASDTKSVSPADRYAGAFASAFEQHSFPCASGKFDVKPEDLILYFGKDTPGDACRRLDFTDISEEALVSLADACDAATFGLNNEDVLDETYRKAGKLDTKFFLLGFDPEQSGLINQIRPIMLEGYGQQRRITFERYKLNVYGPGSFFKSHKDTPRGTDMFGSLVVVLPTQHSGGALTFQHGDLKFMVDSARVVSQSSPSSPCIAFVAFYSDVSHEVEPVTSGYRVTVTYNLYFADAPPAGVRPFSHVQEVALSKVFQDLLKDPTVLPEGGSLGFGSKHGYAMNKLLDRARGLRRLQDSLKGSDAILAKVCSQLQLPFNLKVLYHEEMYDGDEVLILCSWLAHANASLDGEAMWKALLERGGQTVSPWPNEFSDDDSDHDSSDYDDSDYDDYDDSDGERPRIEKKVLWATKPKPNDVELTMGTYATYGNEPSQGATYYSLCFIVDIPAVGSTLRPVTET